MGHICDSPIFVVAGISKWPHDRWGYSHSTGHCHHCIRDRLIQGRKILEGFGPFPEELKSLQGYWSDVTKRITASQVTSGEKGLVVNHFNNKLIERRTAHEKVTIKYCKTKKEH